MQIEIKRTRTKEAMNMEKNMLSLKRLGAKAENPVAEERTSEKLLTPKRLFRAGVKLMIIGGFCIALLILIPYHPEFWITKSESLIGDPIIDLGPGERSYHIFNIYPCLENARDMKIECEIHETTGKRFHFLIFDFWGDCFDWCQGISYNPIVDKDGIRSCSFTLRATEECPDYGFGVENRHVHDNVTTKFTATLEWEEENNYATVFYNIKGIILGVSLICVSIGFLCIIIAPIAKYIYKSKETTESLNFSLFIPSLMFSLIDYDY